MTVAVVVILGGLLLCWFGAIVLARRIGQRHDALITAGAAYAADAAALTAQVKALSVPPVPLAEPVPPRYARPAQTYTRALTVAQRAERDAHALLQAAPVHTPATPAEGLSGWLQPFHLQRYARITDQFAAYQAALARARDAVARAAAARAALLAVVPNQHSRLNQCQRRLTATHADLLELQGARPDDGDLHAVIADQRAAKAAAEQIAAELAKLPNPPSEPEHTSNVDRLGQTIDTLRTELSRLEHLIQSWKIQLEGQLDGFSHVEQHFSTLRGQLNRSAPLVENSAAWFQFYQFSARAADLRTAATSTGASRTAVRAQTAALAQELTMRIAALAPVVAAAETLPGLRTTVMSEIDALERAIQAGAAEAEFPIRWANSYADEIAAWRARVTKLSAAEPALAAEVIAWHTELQQLQGEVQTASGLVTAAAAHRAEVIKRLPATSLEQFDRMVFQACPWRQLTPYEHQSLPKELELHTLARDWSVLKTLYAWLPRPQRETALDETELAHSADMLTRYQTCKAQFLDRIVAISRASAELQRAEAAALARLTQLRGALTQVLDAIAPDPAPDEPQLLLPLRELERQGYAQQHTLQARQLESFAEQQRKIGQWEQACHRQLTALGAALQMRAHRAVGAADQLRTAGSASRSAAERYAPVDLALAAYRRQSPPAQLRSGTEDAWVASLLAWREPLTLLERELALWPATTYQREAQQQPSA